MDKYQNRRRRLQQLIQEKAEGNAAAFGRLYGYDRAQVSQFLSPNYNKGRSIGENAVAELERRVGLPEGWLDQQEQPQGAAFWPFSTPVEHYFALDDEKKRRLDERVADFIDGARTVKSDPHKNAA